MKSLLAAAVILTAGTVAVYAQSNNPITERKDLMKAVGAAARTGSQLAKGEMPYDAAKARQVLEVFQKTGQVYASLFPDNTRTGDTKAAPRVWEDKAGFQAANAKFTADATAALGKTADQASFAAAFGAVAANCGSCHQGYRLP